MSLPRFTLPGLSIAAALFGATLLSAGPAAAWHDGPHWRRPPPAYGYHYGPPPRFWHGPRWRHHGHWRHRHWGHRDRW